MIEIISAIVVIAALVAIITFMFRGLASPSGAGGGLFVGYGSTGSLIGFGGGLLAAVAASTALANTNAGAGGGASAGAVLAVAYFLLTGLRLTIGIRWVSGMVGTFGFVALVVFLIAGTGCAVIPLWQRLLILGLVLVWGALGAVGSLLVGRPRIPSMLAAFGALKIAVFLSAPLGVSLLSLPIAAWVVACIAAGLLGAMSALAPQFVIGLAAVVIGVASIGVATVVGDTCSAGPDIHDLSALAGFAVVYLLLKLLLGRWVRR